MRADGRIVLPISHGIQIVSVLKLKRISNMYSSKVPLLPAQFGAIPGVDFLQTSVPKLAKQKGNWCGQCKIVILPIRSKGQT